jgi:hypothetical protein
MDTRRVLWGGAALVACLGFSRSSSAQESQVPFDGAIDVQLFELAPGPGSFLTVTGGEVAPEGQLGLQFLLTFLTDPLTVYNVRGMDEIVDEAPRTEVVQSVLAGELAASYGLSSKYQLGVSLPLLFSLTGEGINPADAMPTSDGLQATGLGDLRVEFKASVWQSGRTHLALAPAVTVPTSFGSGGNEFLGDDLPSLRARAALQWSSASGALHAAGNAGVLLRKPREIYSSTVGQQLTYGAAGAYAVNERVSFIAELFGRTGLTSPQDLDGNPLEVSGAVRVAATGSLGVLAGGGTGLVRGIGSPGLRVFLSLGWSPGAAAPVAAASGPRITSNDRDGDLREDAVDRCPDQREDIDGFDDDDGCPELDNDKDGTADLEDRCPLEAEDRVKPHDRDGCPASKRDSDDDGVADHLDRCVDGAEDFDEFDDGDGCPESDNDGDGVNDDEDRCPLCAEDRDQKNDTDGCPDLDDDADGVADGADRCPGEAEVLNGVSDEDGCPDRGGKVLARRDGDRIVFTEPLRFDGSRLRSDGVMALGQAAAAMRPQRDVSKWRLVVVAARGRDEEAARSTAEKQAQLLAERLDKLGVPKDRIEAVGATADKGMVAIVALERSDAGAEGAACPAALQAKPKTGPAVK